MTDLHFSVPAPGGDTAGPTRPQAGRRRAHHAATPLIIVP